jgi:transcription elongation factor GreA-like protein
MPDHLSNVLIDQNNINIIPLDKAFEALLNLADGGAFIHHQEVGVAIFVDFSNSTQQESNTSVLKQLLKQANWQNFMQYLVSDHGNQFSFHSSV